MIHSRRTFLVPARPRSSGRKEGILVETTIAQLALLSLPVFVLYGRPWLACRRRWEARQRERRQASDEVMRRRSLR